MKHSSEFYKVMNAVINTLNHGDSVAYVSGGQGGSGFGLFSPDEDLRELRIQSNISTLTMRTMVNYSMIGHTTTSSSIHHLTSTSYQHLHLAFS